MALVGPSLLCHQVIGAKSGPVVSTIIVCNGGRRCGGHVRGSEGGMQNARFGGLAGAMGARRRVRLQVGRAMGSPHAPTPSAALPKRD
jgi:hypothetical protein